MPSNRERLEKLKEIKDQILKIEAQMGTQHIQGLRDQYERWIHEAETGYMSISSTEEWFDSELKEARECYQMHQRYG